MLPLEHSAIPLTCIIKAIIGLENQFLVFLKVAIFGRFYCTVHFVCKQKVVLDVNLAFLEKHVFMHQVFKIQRLHCFWSVCAYNKL